MRILAPDYYPHFRCIADKCRHTCCKGWEIDIDDASLTRYRQVPGEIGQRLQAAMVEDEEGAHFALGEEERCPFLNAQGLCDLYTALGEESLCQICTDHPRFRSFWSDCTEIGLGLSCEAATRLILAWTGTVSLIPVGEEDAEEEPLTQEEADLLDDRERLTACVQRRDVQLMQRMHALPGLYNLPWPACTPAEAARQLLDLERLDPAWTAQLQSLAKDPVTEVDMDKWAVPLEQLMVYLLYRHMPLALDEGDPAAHLLFCCFVWQVVVWLFALSGQEMEHLTDIARMASAEIEYSEENRLALVEAFAQEM